jgi:DNA-binding NarL/FixJ family response regulator
MHRKQSKTVLIVDDEPYLRRDLADTLRDRGFQVEVAASPDEARGLVAGMSAGPDVCVLDMFFENTSTTGAQVGLEIRRQFPEHPPEFLIYSGHGEQNYYQQAFQLDAANYLPKGEFTYIDVVSHCRVLALRRALSGGRPGLLEEIDQIASHSQSRTEALGSFWREVVRPELDAAMGTPFLLLYSEAEQTRSIASMLDLPLESRAYGWIQRLLDIRADPSEPLVLDPRAVPLVEATDERITAAAILRRLRGTAFIPLAQLGRSKASLGLMQANRQQQRFPEDALSMARLVSTYVQPALTSPLLALTTKWAHLRQQTILETTSRFCLYVGQEQVSLVDKASECDALGGDSLAPRMNLLRRLGEELRAVGELLGEVAIFPNSHRPEERQAVEVAGLVHDVWEDLLIDFPQHQRDLLVVEGNCCVFARPGSLYVAIGRILQWLANRNSDLAKSGMARIQVTCSARDSKILIRDGSDRLTREARRRLFSLDSVPDEQDFQKLGRRGEFLSLYLSKVLIEMESGARLEDVTDSSEQETGHCLLIQFPSTGGEQDGGEASAGAHG